MAGRNLSDLGGRKRGNVGILGNLGGIRDPLTHFYTNLAIRFNFRTRLRISGKPQVLPSQAFIFLLQSLRARYTYPGGTIGADNDALLFNRHGRPSLLRCTSLLSHGNRRQYPNPWSPIPHLCLPTFLDRNQYRQEGARHQLCRCRAITVVVSVSRPNQDLMKPRESLRAMFLTTATPSPRSAPHKICKKSSVLVPICKLISFTHRQVWGILVSSHIEIRRTSSFLNNFNNRLSSKGGNMPSVIAYRHRHSTRVYDKRSSNGLMLEMHRLTVLTIGTRW